MLAAGGSPEHPSQTDQDSFREYLYRAVRVGLFATAFAVVALVLFALLPNHGPLQLLPYLLLIITVSLGGLLVAALPWRRLLVGQAGIWCLYAWSISDILLITFAIAITGGARSEMYLIYMATTLFFAASYPLRSQVLLTLLTFFCYGAVIVAGGGRIDTGVFFFHLVMIALVAYMASFLARELKLQMAGHARAARAAERRSQVLVGVTVAARAMNTLDPQQLLDAVADALLKQGFSAVALWSTRGEGDVVHACAVGDPLLMPRGLAVSAVIERALAQGGVVQIERDELATLLSVAPQAVPASLLAAPVWVDGRAEAVLLGAHTAAPAEAIDAEAFALLAAQTGRALETLALAEEVRRSEKRFRALVQHAADAVIVIDTYGMIRYASPAAERFTGCTADDLLGCDALRFIADDERQLARMQIVALIGRPHASERLDLHLRHRSGEMRRVEAVVTNLLDEPSVGGVVINLHDVTERMALHERLQHLAYHDPLTGLLNRVALRQRLDHLLARPARERRCAVLFLDLDRFKVINDSLGHAAGDKLLQIVAQRLLSCIREGDTVARLGGDEFTVLLPGARDLASAREVAERILQAFHTPFVIDGRTLYLTPSIGIALCTDETQSTDQLLRYADLALYRAKESGRARFAVFDANLSAEAMLRLELEEDLRRALATDEIYLVYQPQIDLRSGRLIGFEALARWRHPRHGTLAPDRFIPLAEETGLIVPLGLHVLKLACRQAQAWRRSEAETADLRVSVNVSARQFRQTSFVEDVAAVLHETGLPGSALTLEITESTLMHEHEETLAILAALKRLDVMLAIDDFGAGYSSLSYLRRYPIDELKLDRGFVRGIDRDTNAAALVTGVVTLGQMLGLTLVAEGVETERELETLRVLGCPQAQGFMIARPLSAAAAGRLLRRGAPAGDGALADGDDTTAA